MVLEHASLTMPRAPWLAVPLTCWGSLEWRWKEGPGAWHVIFQMTTASYENFSAQPRTTWKRSPRDHQASPGMNGLSLSLMCGMILD